MRIPLNYGEGGQYPVCSLCWYQWHSASTEVGFPATVLPLGPGIKVHSAHSAPRCRLYPCCFTCFSPEDKEHKWHSPPAASSGVRAAISSPLHPVSIVWPPGKCPSRRSRHPVSTGELGAMAPAYRPAPALAKASEGASSSASLVAMCCSLAMKNQLCKTWMIVWLRTWRGCARWRSQTPWSRRRSRSGMRRTP